MKFNVQLSETTHDTIRTAICQSMTAQDRNIIEVATNADIAPDMLRRYMAHERDMMSERLGRIINALRVRILRRADGERLILISFRKLITKHIKSQKWSAAVLAEQSKLDCSEVTRFLNGQCDMCGRKISAVLAPLGLTVLPNITKPPIPLDWLRPLKQLQCLKLETFYEATAIFPTLIAANCTCA